MKDHLTDSTSSPAWTPGYPVAGRYRLDAILGQGGFAQVWRATDLLLSRSVAVKVLHPTITVGDHKRFVAEARVLAKLNAPSIVAVFDVGVDAGRAFLVMEFIEGYTLSVLIRKAPIPIGLAVHVAAQIATGLDYLHKQGIVHRDIKPGNILLYRSPEEDPQKAWTAKVSDFGLARIVEGDLASRSLSGPGLMAGTIPYMAPELITDGKVGPSNDIFALGVTLFEVFTRCLPFPESDIQRLIARRDKEPPDPSSINPNLPLEIADFIKRMLAPKPGHRPRSAGEVAAFFQSLTGPYPITDWTPAEEPPSAKPRTEVSFLDEADAPKGFFSQANVRRSLFFENESIRFAKVEETLRFYREHLNKDYETLIRQARTTYRLWAGCVATGAIILLAGVAAMLAGRVTEGIATSAATIIVFFIQKVFQQREDFYRASAAVKAQHLEYGNHWVLVIQSIDAIRDPKEQSERQAKLVDVLLEKLNDRTMRSTRTASPRRTRRR